MAFLILFATSCEKEKSVEVSNQISQTEFFKQNVSFTDARVRSLSETKYVREIVLTDFSESGKMPKSIIFDGTTLFDDGSYNDLKTRDGIYTSAETFNHSEINPFYEDLKIRSVMEESVIDKKFKFNEKLEIFLTSQYSKNSLSHSSLSRGGPVATLECDIEFGTCGCRADRWGWCDCCCFTVSNCKGKIGWE